MVSYLGSHDSVHFVADYVGDPFLEFGVFVKDPYSVRSILFDVESKFGLNFVDVALLQKEFVSVGGVGGVFG